MEYWYSAQLRNYRLQFIRAFSGIYVNQGKDANGVDQIVKVPCRYGDPSRIASTIVAGNSENKLPTVPFISCTVSGLTMNAARRQDPTFVEKIQVDDRQYDEENRRYLQTIGNRYTIQRYMPVPYDLTMQVDVWTNNTSIKEQILEQIMMLYNPSINLQTSVNPLDWTVLSVIEMQDDIQWSSRSIPIGTENPIDVMTLRFKIPIWINPPAKVQKQKIIEEIVTNIVAGSKEDPEQWDWTEYEFLNRVVTTPGNLRIELSWVGDNTYRVSLRTEDGSDEDPRRKPTITTSKVNPVFTVGTSFRFNGIPITITNPDLSAVVAAGHAALANTPYNIMLFNKNSIQFINNEAGDNIFGNMVGQPIQDMGLLPTLYPGGTLSWARLFSDYGQVRGYSAYGSNASQLRIRLDLSDPNKDIVGWMDMDLVNQNLLMWKIDPASLPSTTMPPINAIVDPQKSGPGSGLAPAKKGQRYLIVNSPSTSSGSWGSLMANPNDIIEFNGNEWKVSFSSQDNTYTTQYITNLFNGKLLQWFEGGWEEYVATSYGPGEWRFAL